MAALSVNHYSLDLWQVHLSDGEVPQMEVCRPLALKYLSFPATQFPFLGVKLSFFFKKNDQER